MFFFNQHSWSTILKHPNFLRYPASLINQKPNKAIVIKCTKKYGDPSITSYGHLDDKCFWDEARLVFSSFWKKNLQCALSDFSKLCTLLSLEILISYIYTAYEEWGKDLGNLETWLFVKVLEVDQITRSISMLILPRTL